MKASRLPDQHHYGNIEKPIHAAFVLYCMTYELDYYKTSVSKC